MHVAKRSSTGAFTNFLWSLAALAVALVPTWLFLILRNVLSPEGFWQNAVIAGFGVYILGGFQFLLLVLFIVFLVFLWGDASS